MVQVRNGMSAGALGAAVWRKSSYSNPSGNCVELAELPAGEIAMRNSRHPVGPALVYLRDEVAVFVQRAKDGEFDDLIR